jgi:hypothetical protein
MSTEDTQVDEIEEDEIDGRENEAVLTPDQASAKFKQVLLASGLEALLKKNSGITIKLMKIIAEKFRMAKNLSKLLETID